MIQSVKPEVPNQNEEFTEKELYKRFGTQTMGGIRYTKKHNRVILIDSVFSNYKDRVDEKKGVVIYTGTGEEDQDFESRSGKFNSKIRDPNSVLSYFQKPEPNKVIFKHLVKYLEHNIDEEKNRKGVTRKVIKFKLKIIS